METVNDQRAEDTETVPKCSQPKRAKIRGDEYIVHPQDFPRERSPPDQWPNKPAWRNSSPRWSRSNSPDYHSSCLERRSRSPSPKPTPSHSDYHYRVGITHTEHRSRSPSPSSAHSLPLQRRPGGRKLPPTPNQPSRLRFDVRSMEGINFSSHSPSVPPHHGVLSVMNFPRLNPSPSHLPKLQMQPLWRERTSNYLGIQGLQGSSLVRVGQATSSVSLPPGLREREQYQYPTLSYHDQRFRHPLEEPLSFEAAASFGRGSRQLPSPLPNGYKPGRERLPHEPPLLGLRTGRVGLRRSDSDEDDWC